jgi:hypothetical protein
LETSETAAWRLAAPVAAKTPAAAVLSGSSASTLHGPGLVLVFQTVISLNRKFRPVVLPPPLLPHLVTLLDVVVPTSQAADTLLTRVPSSS